MDGLEEGRYPPAANELSIAGTNCIVNSARAVVMSHVGDHRNVKLSKISQVLVLVAAVWIPPQAITRLGLRLTV